MPLRIDALIPAWNEEEKLGATIESLLAQDRPLDRIVIIPNGCVDGTAEIARSYAAQHPNIVVMELPALEHRKSEALNKAWSTYSKDADVVISIDADTTFDPEAISQWEEEYSAGLKVRGAPLGGSTAKAIVMREGFWGRMQKQEYSKVVDSSLLRGSTSVLAGAGTAFSGQGLREVAAVGDGRQGPWSYATATEDYEISLMLRKLGWATITSPDVRMYTDGMKNLKSLWGQRMKWGVGQYHELLRHGVTKYTVRDWGAISLTALLVFIQLLWVWVMSVSIASGTFRLDWFWWIVYPSFFVLFQLFLCFRMAFVDRKDILYAVTVAPYLLYGLLGIAWIIWSWLAVARERVTGRHADRWQLQANAEA